MVTVDAGVPELVMLSYAGVLGIEAKLAGAGGDVCGMAKVGADLAFVALRCAAHRPSITLMTGMANACACFSRRAPKRFAAAAGYAARSR